MEEVELTEEMIAAAMTKADVRVCVGSNRCFALPDRLHDAPVLHTERPLLGRVGHGCLVPSRDGNARPHQSAPRHGDISCKPVARRARLPI
jgi:hypothetical protein